MKLSNLNSKKRDIICEALKKKNNNERTEVEFSKTKFKVYKYYDIDINTNCKALNEIDLKIINSFDIKKLNAMYQDLDYLKQLITNRKLELLEPKTITELHTWDDKDSNKKIYHITVTQYIKHKDIYGDHYLLDTDAEKTLEHYEISNTKPYQGEIQDKIQEMKIKYNL